jgi:hypothetical protein
MDGILDVSNVYGEIEKEMLPFMIKRSRRLANAHLSIEFDDAMQEGRMVILEALKGYKSDKDNGNGPGPFVLKLLRHAYINMAFTALMKSKVPHVVEIGDDGVKRKLPRFLLSLDAMLDPAQEGDAISNDKCLEDVRAINPEMNALNEKVRANLGIFTMMMYNTLKGRDHEVFRCKVHPSIEFLDMLYLDGADFVYRDATGRLLLSDDFNVTAAQIGKFLGMNNNEVGWSLYKIRELFLNMARCDENFVDLFEHLVVDKRWPMVHMCAGEKEAMNFKRRVFKKRNLNSKQSAVSELSISEQKDDDGKPYYSRLIRWYDWGAVVVVKKANVYYTVICEGRFNKNTGDIFGWVVTGAHVKMPLDWYKSMVKRLKDA